MTSWHDEEKCILSINLDYQNSAVFTKCFFRISGRLDLRAPSISVKVKVLLTGWR